jgi:hypothetical protein
MNPSSPSPHPSGSAKSSTTSDPLFNWLDHRAAGVLLHPTAFPGAYGNGTFIVRGFGPAAFQLNGRRGEANDAVNKAAGKDQPVSQEIAVSVKGDDISCAINGKVVGTYKKADAVGAGSSRFNPGTTPLAKNVNPIPNATPKTNHAKRRVFDVEEGGGSCS